MESMSIGKEIVYDNTTRIHKMSTLIKESNGVERNEDGDVLFGDRV